MVYLLIAAAIFAADYWIKESIEKKETVKEKEILKGQVIVTKLHNKGAFLNFMEKNTGAVKLISASMLGALAGILIFLLPRRETTILKTGLAFAIGGAASNVLDRIRRGYVVDYFSFKWIKKVVFNLGDLFIFLGTLLIMIHTLFHKE